MTKLEEIARAMVAPSMQEATAKTQYIGAKREAFLDSIWQEALPFARAAVEALKPPTDTMLEAGAECIPGEEAAPSRYKHDAEEVFRAMIDAILNETEQSS